MEVLVMLVVDLLVGDSWLLVVPQKLFDVNLCLGVCLNMCGVAKVILGHNKLIWFRSKKSLLRQFEVIHHL